MTHIGTLNKQKHSWQAFKTVTWTFDALFNKALEGGLKHVSLSQADSARLAPDTPVSRGHTYMEMQGTSTSPALICYWPKEKAEACAFSRRSRGPGT